VSFRLKPFKPHLVENDIERQCLDLMAWRGYWPARLHAGTFKTVDGKRFIKGLEKGTPDYGIFHEFYPGFLLETKAPGKTLSDEQFMRINQLSMGYRLAVCVVDSVETFKLWLDAHEYNAQKKWQEVLSRVTPARGP